MVRKAALKKIGRARKPTRLVKKILKKEYSEYDNNTKTKAWYKYTMGEKHRYPEIFSWQLARKPINHLVSLNKKKVNVMFLGPGKGEYILPFKEDLSRKGINSTVDVFSLDKGSISPEVKKEISKNYSKKTAFESLDPKNPHHKKIFLETIGKYDLIMAPRSVSYQTNYPAFSMYQAALMLSRNGKAYMEVRSLESVKFISDLGLEKKLNNLETVFSRFISVYNKKYKKNNHYSFNIIGDLKKDPVGAFIEIERIK